MRFVIGLIAGLCATAVVLHAGMTRAGGNEQQVELRAGDATQATYDFLRARHGGSIADGVFSAHDSQVAYDVLAKRHLSFGYVRGIEAAVVDLGPRLTRPRLRAGTRAPRLPLSLYETLEAEGGKLYFTDGDGVRRRARDAERVFDRPRRDTVRHVSPRRGTTILLLFAPRGEEPTLIKLFVVEAEEESVTLRWSRLL